MEQGTAQFSALTLELKQLIISVANLHDVQPEQIDDSKPLFRDGLGLDSIDMLEIAVHLEKKYGLKVQNDDKGRLALSNTANLAQAVSEHLHCQASAGRTTH